MGEKIAMRGAAAAAPSTPRQGVAAPGLDTTTKYPNIGSIDDIRQEVDDAHADMRGFYNQEPDEVMRLVSGHLARLVEISKEIRRIEGTVRQLKTVRTNEIDPAMQALFQQFQIHSRLESVRETDFRVAGMNG